MVATPFIAPVNAKPACYRLQVVNPPVTRVVAHPRKGFFVGTHAANSVAYDTIYQSNEAFP